MTAWILGIGFVLLMATGLVIEAVARRDASRRATGRSSRSAGGVATAAELVRICVASRTGRLVAVLIWAWVGWHFLAR